MKPKHARYSGGRSLAQITNHYETEKGIAERLRKSSREERKRIYKTMYDELFRKVPDHPRLTRFKDPKFIAHRNKSKRRLTNRFIDDSTTLAEFGCGDCEFTFEICRSVRFAYGIDIVDQIKERPQKPPNFRLIVYNGYDLDLDRSTVDLVFSDQLIEHIHPDDIELHFQLVKEILKPGGIYIFRTPNILSGPYDISRHFSDVAEGFHLKEWTYTEIAQVIKNMTYRSLAGYWYGKGFLVKFPFSLFITVERLLTLLPRYLRKKVAKLILPYIVAIAKKSEIIT